MLEKKTKIFLLIFLMLTVIAFLLPPGKRGIYLPKPNGQAPVRRVQVALALFQNEQLFHEQLFEQLNKFADNYLFRIRISPIAGPDDDFLVKMWRNDIEIIGLDSQDPRLFEIGFYNTSEEYPASSQTVDALMLSLKRLIEEIPNITFTEIK
jgi:hypothetical protein